MSAVCRHTQASAPRNPSSDRHCGQCGHPISWHSTADIGLKLELRTMLAGLMEVPLTDELKFYHFAFTRADVERLREILKD